MSITFWIVVASIIILPVMSGILGTIDTKITKKWWLFSFLKKKDIGKKND